MADDAVLDAPVVEATVEADLSALETPAAETPAVETETPKVDAVEGTEKPTEAAKPAADADATPLKALNEHLASVRTENPALATQLKAKLVSGLRYEALLKEFKATSLDTLRTNMTAGDAEFKDSVAATDALLYEGGESHTELAANILEDLKSENADTANEVFSSLASHLLKQMKTSDPEGYTARQRDEFLTTSENVGLVQSINDLASALHSGDVASAKRIVGNVVKYFQGQIEADTQRAKPKAAAATTTGTDKVSPAVTTLRQEVNAFVTKTENQVLGGYLGELLRGPLKGLTQAQKVDVADSIKRQLRVELNADKEFARTLGDKWNSMRGKATQNELMRLYKGKLEGEFGRRLVNSVAKTSHPELFRTAPPAPKVPEHKMETVGGKSVKVYQVGAKKPSLVHDDVTVPGHRSFSSSDLELLAISGLGIHKNPKGDYVFVRWSR